ncbi:hypothetical protein CDL12_26194 [Handroanthus impetiginosus]|uniref:SHSP domain-containing protein n=1 Tax=Handroanthus impetiginosus TaxID=429701 RepID=A0A2G9G7N3_9LAMI|nr:hypothetical protein CDL12_26194 [Handroanthus impetiginosus]
MAMHPRGGGTGAPRRGGRSGGVRPVYEDFRPMSEWQDNDESHILNIYLPGFTKEQIKVSTEGKNTIKVRGERLVAGNKWSRFVEDFQVPENGEMNSIQAKYRGGILNITIPKKESQEPREVLPPQPKRDDIQKQPVPQKGQDKVSSEASANQIKDEKVPQPQKTSGDPRTTQGREGDGKQHAPQKRHDKDFPTDDSTKTVVLQDIKDRHEHKEKDIAAERHVDVKEKIVHDEGKKPADSRELPEVETAKKTKLAKDGATGFPEKKADNKELYGAFTKEKYKKAVKGLAELNEERQLLVNMGVAMLVIVALTAYVTYKFASRKDKN